MTTETAGNVANNPAAAANPQAAALAVWGNQPKEPPLPLNASSPSAAASYKVNLIKRNLYLCRQRRALRADDVMVCDCSRDELCTASCINRLMFVECDPKWCPCGELCKNTRFAKRQYADVGLMEPKGPKGYGLMAKSPIKKGDFVMEYVGEVISEEEHAKRKVEYREKEGRRHFYFMSIANGEVIDATKKVSESEDETDAARNSRSPSLSFFSSCNRATCLGFSTTPATQTARLKSGRLAASFALASSPSRTSQPEPS